MWIGFKKGHPRSEDGKFATVANDSGIDHRGDGYLELENMMNSGQHVAPGLECASTAFDGLHKSALIGRPDATPQKQPVSPAVGAPSYAGSQDGKTSNPKRVTDPDKEVDPEDDDARYADGPAEGESSVAWWTLGAMSENATGGAVAADGGAPQPKDPFAQKMRLRVWYPGVVGRCHPLTRPRMPVRRRYVLHRTAGFDPKRSSD